MFKLILVSALLIVGALSIRLGPQTGHIGPDPAEQHYGYITVNGTYKNGAHLFYWMFESRSDPANDPLVLWLTGGPGCSGMLAMLMENGPYTVNNVTNELEINPYSWTNHANVIWIDQPVGTGFSFADSTFDYVVDEKQVAQDLFVFLQEFLQLYPQYQHRDFFVTGESYGGHYVPALGYRILQGQKEGTPLPVTLKGIAIGNGWVDPKIQYGQYAPFAFENKLIGEGTYRALNATYELCKLAIDTHVFPIALDLCGGMMDVILAEAGNINVYDIRKKCDVPPLCYDMSHITTFLTNASIVAQLGTQGHAWASCNMGVHTLLLGDWLANLDKHIPELLAAGVRVLAYSGTDDFVCNYFGGNAWTTALKWPNQQQFDAAAFTPFEVEGTVYGQSRTAAGLTFFEMYAAGHMVPMDQPAATLEMLSRFMAGKPY